MGRRHLHLRQVQVKTLIHADKEKSAFSAFISVQNTEVISIQNYASNNIHLFLCASYRLTSRAIRIATYKTPMVASKAASIRAHGSTGRMSP